MSVDYYWYIKSKANGRESHHPLKTYSFKYFGDSVFFVASRCFLQNHFVEALLVDITSPERFQHAFCRFARAAANHFLRKNLRNLRNRTMVATVACRHFPSAKRRSY